MNTIDKIFGAKKNTPSGLPVSVPSSSPGDTTYTLTEVGRQKVDTSELRSPYLEFCSALQIRGGTASTRDIAEDTRFPMSKVNAIGESMKNSAYVKRIKVL